MKIPQIIISCMFFIVLFLTFGDLLAVILAFILLFCFTLSEKRSENRRFVVYKQSELSVKIVDLISRAKLVELLSEKIVKIVVFQEQASDVERKLKEGLYPNLKKAESQLNQIRNKLIPLETDITIEEENIKRKKYSY